MHRVLIAKIENGYGLAFFRGIGLATQFLIIIYIQIFNKNVDVSEIIFLLSIAGFLATFLKQGIEAQLIALSSKFSKSQNQLSYQLIRNSLIRVLLLSLIISYFTSVIWMKISFLPEFHAVTCFLATSIAILNVSAINIMIIGRPYLHIFLQYISPTILSVTLLICLELSHYYVDINSLMLILSISYAICAIVAILIIYPRMQDLPSRETAQISEHVSIKKNFYVKFTSYIEEFSIILILFMLEKYHSGSPQTDTIAFVIKFSTVYVSIVYVMLNRSNVLISMMEHYGDFRRELHKLRRNIFPLAYITFLSGITFLFYFSSYISFDPIMSIKLFSLYSLFYFVVFFTGPATVLLINIGKENINFWSALPIPLATILFFQSGLSNLEALIIYISSMIFANLCRYFTLLRFLQDKEQSVRIS